MIIIVNNIDNFNLLIKKEKNYNHKINIYLRKYFLKLESKALVLKEKI